MRATSLGRGRGSLGVSRRDMSELAADLFGLALSAGAVDQICQRGAAALARPHERLVEKVLASRAVNIDETGWFTAHEGRTMWTATTPEAAIFRVAEDRHRDRLKESYSVRTSRGS
jgi:hypothetical protein